MPGPQVSLNTKVCSDFLPKLVNFCPIFSPKLGEDQKQKKNRSSQNLSPIYSPNLGEDQKKKGLHRILV